MFESWRASRVVSTNRYALNEESRTVYREFNYQNRGVAALKGWDHEGDHSPPLGVVVSCSNLSFSIRTVLDRRRYCSWSPDFWLRIRRDFSLVKNSLRRLSNGFMGSNKPLTISTIHSLSCTDPVSTLSFRCERMACDFSRKKPLAAVFGKGKSPAAESKPCSKSISSLSSLWLDDRWLLWTLLALATITSRAEANETFLLLVGVCGGSPAIARTFSLVICLIRLSMMVILIWFLTRTTRKVFYFIVDI